ncbi:EF-hand domain-containing protein [Gaetbulibacter jejuensis]|uniref:EF-hand domain-containing protein n=1 Tax=Gaetbulibacter jejuensis TaxID=584607 RepID=A0ABP3V4N0_9FLAO
MKRQFYHVVAVIGVLCFMSCKSSENTAETKSNEQRESGGVPNVTELIKEMDANGDGKLSKEEVKGPLAEDFSKIDTNEDGFLSLEELKNAPKPSRDERGGRPQRGRN